MCDNWILPILYHFTKQVTKGGIARTCLCHLRVEPEIKEQSLSSAVTIRRFTMAHSAITTQVDDCPPLSQITTLTESYQQPTSPSIMHYHSTSANGHSSQEVAASSTRIYDLTHSASNPDTRKSSVRMKVLSIMSLSRSKSTRRSTDATTTRNQHNRASLSFSSSRQSHFSFCSESSISVRSSRRPSLERLKSLFRPNKFKQNEGSADLPDHIVGQSDARENEEGHHGFRSIRYELTTPATSPVSKSRRGTSIKNLFRLRSSKKTNIEPQVENLRITAPFQRPPRPQRPEEHLCPDPIQHHAPQQRSLSRRSGLAAATRLDNVPEEAEEEEKLKKRWSGGSQNRAPSIVCADGRYPNHGALQRATTPPSANTQTNDALRKKARRKIKTTSPELLAYINGVGDQFLDSRTAEYALAPSSPAPVSELDPEPRSRPYRTQERPFNYGESSRTAVERHSNCVSRTSQYGFYNVKLSSVESLASSPRIVDDAIAVLIARAQNMHVEAAQRLHHALLDMVNREEDDGVYSSSRQPRSSGEQAQERADPARMSDNADVGNNSSRRRSRSSVCSNEFPEEEINRVYDEIFGPRTQS